MSCVKLTLAFPKIYVVF